MHNESVKTSVRVNAQNNDLCEWKLVRKILRIQVPNHQTRHGNEPRGNGAVYHRIMVVLWVPWIGIMLAIQVSWVVQFGHEQYPECLWRYFYASIHRLLTRSTMTIAEVNTVLEIQAIIATRCFGRLTPIAEWTSEYKNSEVTPLFGHIPSVLHLVILKPKPTTHTSRGTDKGIARRYVSRNKSPKATIRYLARIEIQPLDSFTQTMVWELLEDIN